MQFERIQVEIGQTLAHQLQYYNVCGIQCNEGEKLERIVDGLTSENLNPPECEGGCSIIVDEPWFSRLGQVHHLEQLVLDTANTFIKHNSRLSCCLKIEPWMNEMIIKIPDNEYVVY